MGYYSTLMLNALCVDRELISLEFYEQCLGAFAPLVNDNHKMFLVKDWAKLPDEVMDNYYSIIFVDQEPVIERMPTIRRLADKADFIVVHDMEREDQPDYNFQAIIPLFKYMAVDRRLLPWTGVFSNVTDPGPLLDLPEVSKTRPVAPGVVKVPAIAAAAKSEVYEPITEKIVAVKSIPRFGCNAINDCQANALHACGINIWPGSGVYWHEQLTALMRRAAEDFDWIMVLDHDSAFTQAHVRQLIKRFRLGRWDALCAAQAQREISKVIGGGAEDAGDDFMQLQSAHFGLTLINAKALKEIERPWFAFREDSAGWWDGMDRVQADIWFWRQWIKAGKTIALDTTVRIGHLEDMIKCVDANGQIYYSSVRQWQQDNGILVY